MKKSILLISLGIFLSVLLIVFSSSVSAMTPSLCKSPSGYYDDCSVVHGGGNYGGGSYAHTSTTTSTSNSYNSYYTVEDSYNTYTNVNYDSHDISGSFNEQTTTNKYDSSGGILGDLGFSGRLGYCRDSSGYYFCNQQSSAPKQQYVPQQTYSHSNPSYGYSSYPAFSGGYDYSYPSYDYGYYDYPYTYDYSDYSDYYSYPSYDYGYYDYSYPAYDYGYYDYGSYDYGW